MPHPELDFFADLNAATPKVSRSERQALIREHFPSVEQLDWARAFTADVALMGRLIRDILKLNAAEPGRPGPRASVEYRDGVSALRQLIGDDYCHEPLARALAMLRGDRSLRALSVKIGCSKSQVVRLLAGEVDPTPVQMQRTATAFGKHPSFFLEWRAGAVAAAIGRQLADSPEASVVAYRQLMRSVGA